MEDLLSLKEEAFKLSQGFQREVNEKVKILYQLDERRQYLQSLLIETEKKGVTEKLRSYVTLKYKVQLMTLSKAIHELESYEKVEDIPTIVLHIHSSSPFILFRNMKIYTLLKDIGKEIKEGLLKKFLETFENHLSEDSTPWERSVKSQKSSTWMTFLKQARSWLLAYTLVTLLVPSLMESKQAVLEAFQSAVDEAFTPLWGRFFHHLKQGREAGSSQQFFWTFAFTRSFTHMLLGLCEHITSADQLKKLCDLDYASAGREMIVEKAVRLLRAHVALILVDQRISDEGFACRLVEDVLELDEWMVSFKPALTVSQVFYDAKAFFHRFLWTERDFIFGKLRDQCKETEAFLEAFRAEDNSWSSSLSCYRAVYHCLYFIQMCRGRYCFLPPAAQYILSEVIIEPILCLSLGLFLYRIRSDPSLFAISMGRRKGLDMEHCKEKMNQFSQAVTYFQTALGSEDRRWPMLAGSNSRCRRRWDIVQSWMPKILISDAQRSAGFSLEGLLKTALKTSDRFQSKKFDYRVADVLSSEDCQGLKDCLILTRGLAITLVDVMERQMEL
eukprot:gene287-310_t